VFWKGTVELGAQEKLMDVGERKIVEELREASFIPLCFGLLQLLESDKVGHLDLVVTGNLRLAYQCKK
jgi:hypothetical protein